MSSAAERELLRTVRGEADLVLDTSALNVHELRARLQDFFGSGPAEGPRVSVVSFGYKYGLPVETPTWWRTAGSCPTRAGSRRSPR